MYIKQILVLGKTEQWSRATNSTNWQKSFVNENLHIFGSLRWISMAFEKRRKITCNNLSLQSCGDTAAVFLYLSLSASRLRIWEGGRKNGSGEGGGSSGERKRSVKKTLKYVIKNNE